MRMRYHNKKVIFHTVKYLASVLFFLGLFLYGSFETNAEKGYTYTYDFWGEYQESSDVYDVVMVLDSTGLGLDKKLSNPSGMFVKDNTIYLCDTGNNRIIEILRENDNFTVTRIIEGFSENGTEQTLLTPNDVFVSDDGYMYICDTGNNRVVKLDMDLNFQMYFLRPEDATFDAKNSFLPMKMIADKVGRVYVLSKNVNKGLIQYENDGTFKGYIGASEVTMSTYEYMWRLFSTKAQRDQQEQFVPTEYDNVALDLDGFMYVVTSNFEEWELEDGDAKPIRRLNTMGKDILIRNGNFMPSGDFFWGEAGGYSGPSKMADITALDNDCYVAVDRIRGRLFGYDSQGNLLYVFGGNGNSDGYFRNPVALEHMGLELLVLDSMNGDITIFKPSYYGSLIYEALDQYNIGDYETSADTWREVMELNGNYDLAYIGIGRSLVRQDEYKEAMELFKLKWDDENYGKAFKLYRKEWIEENISWIFAIAVFILVFPLIISKIKKVKEDVRRYEDEQEKLRGSVQ